MMLRHSSSRSGAAAVENDRGFMHITIQGKNQIRSPLDNLDL